MEDCDKQLRDKLADPMGYIEREYGDDIRRYEAAGKIGRWLMRRRDPDVAEFSDFINAERSVTVAIQSAQQNESNIVVF